MAEYITRCPQCFTSFRISEAHLNNAKGAVRCGSCLYIFNAKEHLVSSSELEQAEQEETQQEEVPPKQPENEIQASTSGDTFEDLLISDDMDTKKEDKSEDLIDSEIHEAFTEVIFSKGDTGEHDFNLFEREIPDNNDEEVIPQDESWALDLLENDTQENIEVPSEEEAQQEEEQHITQEFESSYYKNSFQIIEDEPDTASHTEKTTRTAHDLFNEYDDVEIEEYDYSDNSQLYEQSGTGSSSYLDAIEPEPVEFNWQRHSDFWQSKLLWGGLSCLAGALIAAQIAWIKFDTWSVVEPYRSYYAKACKMLDCKLPDLIDRSKIRTANLVVRSHPSTKNALVVDAVLQNTAQFEQTFPVLDLVFTDHQDRAVAARRLTPRDYLSGELAGRTHMPVKQPVHVAIEIVDPGQEAVGYKISIAD